MILYQIYNKPSEIIKEEKLPEVILAEQIIIVDEHENDKVSDNKLSEQLNIDISKLGSIEKIPVVLRRIDDGIETENVDRQITVVV